MNATETTTKIIHLNTGIKRIVNLLTGRDVIICREKGRWTMMANFNQPDARKVLGKFRTVAACASAIA